MSNDSYPTENDRRGFTSPPKFLENLPSSIRRYSYEGIQQLLQIRDLEFDRLQRSMCHLRSGYSQPCSDDSATEYILFDIDPSALERDFLDPDVDTIPFICSSYDLTKGLLLVKMPTQEHSQATHAFDSAISEALRPMHLDKAVQTFSKANIRIGDRGKEGDHGWGPLRPPPGYLRKPAVTLEVAVSETPAKIKQDVDFWLDPNRGNANIAITLRVNRKKPLITIEKWEWQSQQSQRTQHIIIAEDRNGENITVSSSPLIIPFHLLFRRKPSCPAETDLCIGDQQLKGVAEWVWAVQEF